MPQTARKLGPSQPLPMPVETPVTKANVLGALVESVHELGLEARQWRVFGQDVVSYLRDRALVEDFGAYQAAANAARALALPMRSRKKPR